MPPVLGKPLVNLSSYSLSVDQANLLTSGSRLALGPMKKDGSLLVACVENGLSYAREPERSLARARIVDVCSRSKLTQSRFWGVVKELKDVQDVVYMKADKGETLVIMDRQDHRAKMEVELEAGAYVKVSKDPTGSVVGKLDRMLKSFSDQSLKACKVRNPIAPRAFTQIKLHKPGNPLRIIVSGRRSPTAALEKTISLLLKKYTKLNPSYVQDSAQVVQILRDHEPMSPGEKMLSLDIVKLFPQLPRDQTLEAVHQVLERDSGVDPVLASEIVKSLDFIFQTSYFRYDSCFYKQMRGSPIGSSVSPVIAEIFLTFHEDRARALLTTWPRLFIRYVDDHLVILKSSDMQFFLRTLNGINEAIQYTVEEAGLDGISFLDLWIEPTPSGFSTSVFRKKTCTGVMVSATSLHHPQQKTGTWSTLVSRAFKLCSDETRLNSELTFLKELATLNGFSPIVVERAVVRVKRKLQRQQDITLQNLDQARSSFCVIPFFGAISTKIGSILKKATGRRIAFFPVNKLGDALFNTKDPLEVREASGIYKIRCRCGVSYIGQTSRNFGKRLAEHRAAVTNFTPEVSAVSRHFWKVGCDLGIEWNTARVVTPTRYPFGVHFRELLEIALESTNNSFGIMNDQENFSGLEIWLGLKGKWLFPIGDLARNEFAVAYERGCAHTEEVGLEVSAVRSLEVSSGRSLEVSSVSCQKKPSIWAGRLRDIKSLQFTTSQLCSTTPSSSSGTSTQGTTKTSGGYLQVRQISELRHEAYNIQTAEKQCTPSGPWSNRLRQRF